MNLHMFEDNGTARNLIISRQLGIFGSLIVSVVLAVSLFPNASAASARAKILDEARQDFQENCVACHGADATGSGTLGGRLVRAPKDLTEISARNGGTYPFWRIFEIIAGETQVEGHDTFQMPEYSKRMRGDDFAPGYLPAHVRILSLTHYLESIQKDRKEAGGH